MYRRILVPTDGSDAARGAVEQAYEIAERFDAAVHLLYVIDADQQYPFERTTDRALESSREDGERLTTDAAAQAPVDVDVSRAVEEGTPHGRILEYADGHDVDLIVMGTHGRRGLDRFLLGSVTERVLRSASASVLVTRVAETAVDSAASAIDAAGDALAARGHDDVTILEEPYEQGGYWIVRADDGTVLFNVHIDRATGNTNIAQIEQR